MHYKEENTKSIISQTLRIAQEKSFVQKIIFKSIRIFPVNLATFEQYFFCASFVTSLATCQIIVKSIQIFPVNLATSEQHFFCASYVTSLATITQKLKIGKI